MAEKQCGKCGEMVDEAKAFCPGCGHSFVDEKQRTTRSDFDLSENTIRLGDTMYNQMLSDMGLSISKQPNREEGNAKVVTPAVPTSSEQKAQPPPATNRKSKMIWIAVIAVAFIAFGILFVLAVVGGIIFYYR